MIVTVPDARLEAILTSAVLLAQLWPTAAEDVKVIMQLLLMAGPSLAQVLSTGLLRVLTPAAGTAGSHVSLTCRDLVLSALASGENGDPVPEPHLRPGDVRQLAVSGLLAGGRSALARAAV